MIRPSSIAFDGVQDPPLRILLIEDSLAFATLVIQQLREEFADAHSVEHVTPLEEGLQSFQSKRADLVILDAADRIDAEPSRNLVLSLAGIQYVNSTVFEILVNRFKRLGAEVRQLRLCDLNPELADVKAIHHLDRLFIVDPTEVDPTEVDAITRAN